MKNLSLPVALLALSVSTAFAGYQTHSREAWIPFGEKLVRIVVYRLNDQTDVHNELVRKDEWLVGFSEEPVSVRAAILIREEPLSGAGVAYVRLAPLPHARSNPDAIDFTFSGRRDDVGGGRGLKVHETGYPWVEIPYRGGSVGRTKALQDFQRAQRPYVSGRDVVFLCNTWGDRNRDTRINEAFLLDEIKAASDLGAEVIQIDDGWQSGRSINSAFAGGKGVWNGYWTASADFWKPDTNRFPHGLSHVARQARDHGVRLGLWFAPDSSDDAANWNRDAQCLLELNRTCGIDYFKLDSMKTTSGLAYERQRMLFDRLQRESEGRIVIDMDITAERRPGYFGIMTAGPLFIENRYTDWKTYWPHLTLRTLWSLCEVIDPIRLRMEVLNPLRNVDMYGSDPLAPAAYPPETLFAIALPANPLGWFEVQNLAPSTVSAWKPLVSAWKRERDAMAACHVIPIGEKPDGVAWTGFLFAPRREEGVGYVLLFRELSPEADFKIDFSRRFGRPVRIEKMAGSGEADRHGVHQVGRRHFIWLRVNPQGGTDA